MKASDLFMLVAAICIAPHLHLWTGVYSFAAFSVLSLACRYWGKS